MRGSLLIAFGFVSVFAVVSAAQADEVCREFGEFPTREIDRGNRSAAYIYGRVSIKGLSHDSKPQVTVIYTDSVQPALRQRLGRTGNYCFQKRGTGGTILIDIDGVEVLRRAISDGGRGRQREDLEVFAPGSSREEAPPGVVSAKFIRPPNERTAELYQKVGAAERENKPAKAIELVRQIVDVDPEDFVAFAKLGSLLLQSRSLDEASAAFARSLALRNDYTPAILNSGVVLAMQGRYPEAIVMFQRTIALEPTSAFAHRLLGEAYLQERQGSRAIAALDEALRLDPNGMSECHLLKARLYDLVGAKDLAAAEYKAFLEKVKDHPDRKKFEKYIKDNPL